MAYFVRWKVYAQRSLIYYQLVQYVLIILIFLRPYDFSDLIKILIIIGIASIAILIGYFDTKAKILEMEQGHFNKENKELREIRDLLLNIKIHGTCVSSHPEYLSGEGSISKLK